MFRKLNDGRAFSKRNIELDGYLISDTPRDQIPGGTGDKSREVLLTEHAVVLARKDEDWWVPQVLALG